MEKPGVIRWFKIYAATIAILSICLGFCIAYMIAQMLPVLAFIILELKFVDPIADAEGVFWMVTATAVPLLYAIAHLAALVMTGQWAYGYSAILIGLGLFSPITVVVATPLLYFWLKPETKAWFLQQRLGR